MIITLRGKQRQALLGGYMVKGLKKSIDEVGGCGGMYAPQGGGKRTRCVWRMDGLRRSD